MYCIYPLIYVYIMLFLYCVILPSVEICGASKKKEEEEEEIYEEAKIVIR